MWEQLSRQFHFGRTSGITIGDGCASVGVCDYNKSIQIFRLSEDEYNSTICAKENYIRLNTFISTGNLYKTFK